MKDNAFDGTGLRPKDYSDKFGGTQPLTVGKIEQLTTDYCNKSNYGPIERLAATEFDISIAIPTEKQKQQIEEMIVKLNKEQTALRFNNGKLDWSLVPFEGLEEMVRVLEFGAKKYARGNWRNGEGLSFNETLCSLLRHTFAFMNGEDKDPETGLSHIGHIQCNALFLGYFIKYPEKFTRDDRNV